MSAFNNSRIVTEGLITHFDSYNRKSNINVSQSLLNPVWTTGSGGYTNLYQNGSTDENERVQATDPWGNTAIVWETRPNGTAQDDGGWNSEYFSIDRTKLYRFSVWVRRTSSTGGGTFYFGTNSNGAVFGVADSLEKGNPYWDCRGTGGLTQNQWYLVCGHIFPYNTTNTTNHPDTGMYTVTDGKIGSVNFCNIGTDLKWGSGSVNGQHRTYHYYCGDTTTRLQFLSPRIDLCDGTEPTIKEMLSVPQNRWTDISGNGFHAVPVGTSILPYVSNKEMVFGSGNYMTYNIAKTSANNISQTWEAVVKPTTGTSIAGIFGHVNSSGCSYYCNGGICIWSGNYAFCWYDNSNYQFLDSGISATTNQYAHIVCVWEGTQSLPKIYVNGVLRNTGGVTNLNYGGGTNLAYVGYFSATGYPLTGTIENIKHYYNKALTADEVRQNFNSLRSRFGL